MRKVVILIVAAIGTLLPPAGAFAATPEMGSFDNGYASFVDEEVCADAPFGFDVSATEHEYGFFQVFLDKNGEPTRINIHLNYDATISANGKTIIERDTWTTMIYADGSRNVGLSAHLQGPGGLVQHDAGQVVFDVDGNVLYVRGPHDQALGGSFCPALVP